MASFTRLQVWGAMEEVGLVPLFYHQDVKTATEIAGALAAGGARVIEFTNRGDRAFEVFGTLMAHLQQELPDIILGVGSVVEVATAGLYINLGANFVVGSLLNPEVARLCNRRKIAYCPGCATPREIAEAEELGVEIVKLFPGSQVGGPGFVKAIKAPCPWTKLMPTGGVDATPENLKAWFDAGVSCVGIGSALVSREIVARRDWQGLTRLTADCLQWIREARGET